MDQTTILQVLIFIIVLLILWKLFKLMWPTTVVTDNAVGDKEKKEGFYAGRYNPWYRSGWSSWYWPYYSPYSWNWLRPNYWNRPLWNRYAWAY